MTTIGRGPLLARATLDRAPHRRTDEAWLAEAWPRARVVVVDTSSGTRTLARTIEERVELVLLTAADLPEVAPEDRLFLGLDADGVPVFAVDMPLPSVPGASAVSLRAVGHLLDDRDVGLYTTAAALANWHAAYRFAPRTGQRTRACDGGWARIDADGNQIWPRTDPAMIVLVHDGVPGPDGRCLLGRNVAWGTSPDLRRFSCFAGFVEPGESAEAAVVREVREEVGIGVDHIRYMGSQAWPYPGSLMLGFWAEADPQQPLQPNPTEIAEARWFRRRDIAAVLAGERVDADGARVALPPPTSIAHYLIATWLSASDAERAP